MAAGLGFKDFQAGSVLTAADTNGYLMQGILVFATTAARDAAITSPQEGQFAFIKADDTTYYYTGSAWLPSAMDNRAYTSYTPTMVSGSWTVGNGVFTARYKTIGKMVHLYGDFEFGSTSAVTATTFAITLPVTANTAVTPYVYSGGSHFHDVSAGLGVVGISRIQNATDLYLFWNDPEPTPLAVYNAPWSTAVVLPFTFATGDIVAFNIVYEAA